MPPTTPRPTRTTAADEVFISMATYRDENCPTTLTEAFKFVRTLSPFLSLVDIP